jgi:RNase P subunit RPR2
MHCLPLNPGFLCFSKTDYNCPECNHLHEGSETSEALEKSKRGYVFRNCEKCGKRLVIAPDYKGDLLVQMKEKKFKLKMR